jgi:hypothetical protein
MSRSITALIRLNIYIYIKLGIIIIIIIVMYYFQIYLIIISKIYIYLINYHSCGEPSRYQLMTRIEHEKEGQIRTVGLRSLIMDDDALDLSTPFNYYCIN